MTTTRVTYRVLGRCDKAYRAEQYRIHGIHGVAAALQPATTPLKYLFWTQAQAAAERFVDEAFRQGVSDLAIETIWVSTDQDGAAVRSTARTRQSIGVRSKPVVDQSINNACDEEQIVATLNPRQSGAAK